MQRSSTRLRPKLGAANTVKPNVGAQIDHELLDSDDYLYQLVPLLVTHYKPLKIYLFGSKARGDSGPNSDYDLMVIVEKRVSPLKRKTFHNARWDAGLIVASDIVLVTQKYFKDRLHLRSSLPSTVAEEGKLLYAAD